MADPRLRTFGIALVSLLGVWALVDQLMRPSHLRTWHGKLLGFLPYDFRAPTIDRLIGAYWNPDDPRIFTDHVPGIGWSVNVPSLLHRLATAK